MGELPQSDAEPCQPSASPPTPAVFEFKPHAPLEVHKNNKPDPALSAVEAREIAGEFRGILAYDPIAAGEPLYTIADFFRLIQLRAVDVVQMDIAHCGGILAAKKVAAIAAPQDIRVAPHCSIGPVALAAALHFDMSTPNFMIQENFGDFDVPWRSSLVHGWNPSRHGELTLTDAPGLGLDINEEAIAAHPYAPHAFPSLWDRNWTTNFTQDHQ